MRNQLKRTPAQRLTRTIPPCRRRRPPTSGRRRRPPPPTAVGTSRRRAPRLQEEGSEKVPEEKARAEEAHGERVAWLRGHEVVAARAAVGAHRVGEHAVDLRRDRIAAGAWRDCVWRDRERDGIAVGRGASGPRLGLSQTPRLVARRRLDLGRSRILSRALGPRSRRAAPPLRARPWCAKGRHAAETAQAPRRASRRGGGCAGSATGARARRAAA